jgi:hypothetical protein
MVFVAPGMILDQLTVHEIRLKLKSDLRSEASRMHRFVTEVNPTSTTNKPSPIPYGKKRGNKGFLDHEDIAPGIRMPSVLSDKHGQHPESQRRKGVLAVVHSSAVDRGLRFPRRSFQMESSIGHTSRSPSAPPSLPEEAHKTVKKYEGCLPCSGRETLVMLLLALVPPRLRRVPAFETIDQTDLCTPF